MNETVKTDGIFNFTQPVIMAHPQILEAKAFMENGKPKGEPKFSANFVFPADSEDLKAIKALAAKLFRAMFPDKPFSVKLEGGGTMALVVFPFSSGDKLADERKKKGKNDGDWMRGKVIMPARSKYEPKLAYLDGKKIVDVEGDVAKQAAKGKFYFGVEVLAQVNLVPYDAVGKDGKPGVAAYLNMVLSTCKGSHIAGGRSASETFKGYAGSVSGDDPTSPGAGVDMSEEIPY